jgi:hypothetical protein
MQTSDQRGEAIAHKVFSHILIVCLFVLCLLCMSGSTSVKLEGLPESLKRVGTSALFPNEYPGNIYAFNWCLNGDGVTPLRQSAFRITKPLDLKVAGLQAPKAMPLKVCRCVAMYVDVLGWVFVM